MATYYVDAVTGSDADDGLSEANAFATLNHAESVVAAGDTVYVKGPTYAEKLTLVTSGTINDPITWIGYTTTPGDSGEVTITGSASRSSCIDFELEFYNVFQNFHLTNATTALLEHDSSSGGSSGVFINCRFTKGASSPIILATTTGGGFGQVLGASFYNCTFDGFNFITGTQVFGTIHFYFCKIKNVTGTAVSISDFRGGGNFIGNIFENVSSNAITVGSNSTLSIVEGNIFYDVDGDAIQLHGTTNGTVFILNNIFVSIGGELVDIANAPSGTTLHLFYNKYRNVTAGIADLAYAEVNIGTEALTADPFIDAANSNFNLNNITGGGALLRAITFAPDDTIISPMNRWLEYPTPAEIATAVWAYARRTTTS